MILRVLTVFGTRPEAIGRRFGGRDHTTVMHGVKRISELKLTDSQIADDLELLRRALSE